MQSKITKFLVFCFVSCSGPASSEEILKYSLSMEGERLLMINAINESSLAMELPYNFCLSGLGDLSFEIKDVAGKMYQIQTQLNDRCDLGSKVIVAPFGIVGKIFHSDEIKIYYNLPKEKLYVKAKFCKLNKECSESNVIVFYNK